MDSFVDRIDDLLKQNKQTRKDLVKAVGISDNAIAQWKFRGNTPSADTAVDIAKYLGTTVEYLVTGSVDAENVKTAALQDKLARIEAICKE
ncbi:MAG: helix-turn-helix transcriptional regulator [Treponema sp.]|nr:helix-turn-helix transcriptional regulator [Treponema sp.]